MSAPVQVLPPGADEAAWLAARRNGIGASEISAVLGISPWESPFSLYWRKANGWEIEDASPLEAGRRLEPVIADWFSDTHEDLFDRPAGLYRHSDRPWQLATPDRLVLDRRLCGSTRRHTYPLFGYACKGCSGGVVAVLECKHPYSWEGWGETGTDDVPVHYRAQVLWQLDTLGVDRGYLAAYANHEFRWYVIPRDETDLPVMRAAGAEWWRRFEAGEPPDIDGHTATGRVLRQLHPLVEDRDVEVPVELAEAYRVARSDRTAAEAEVALAENQIRALLGNARRAMCNGKLVASRSVYDQAGDSAELTALEDDWPVVDRLNPGRAASYVA